MKARIGGGTGQMVNRVSCIRFLVLLVTPTVFNGGCNPGGPKKTTPTITWAAPAAITYGTALSSTQLNATASVSGVFVYTPSASTVLSAGTQTLSVAFTPTDSANYTSASGSVSIVVNAANSGGVGPSGGTVNGFYGASVTVPAGALSAKVD